MVIAANSKTEYNRQDWSREWEKQVVNDWN